MKVTSDRIEFLAALGVVARAVSTRTSVQTLTGVRLLAENGRLALAATDMELSLRCSVAASVSEEGGVVVPGRLLLDIARRLPDGEVVLWQEPDKGFLVLSCGSVAYELDTLSLEDFPQLPAIDEHRALELPVQPFIDGVTHASRATSRDEARPVLTGILVRFEGGDLITVGTDAYRMSFQRSQLSLQVGDEPLEAIIPSRALAELTRLAPSTTADHFTFYVGANQVVFGADDTWLTARRIDGQFPNYTQFSPDSLRFEAEAKIPRDELVSVISRVAVVALRNTPIRLRFERGRLVVSARTQDVGGAQGTLPIDYTGEEIELGFNPEFLRHGLESVAESDVRLRLISPLRPVVLSGAGEDAWYLIMPIRLAA